MGSVDFKAFCQAEAEEQARLARIYLGQESDPGNAGMHFLPNHLLEMSKKPMPMNLRALLSHEYNTLMAAARAAAVSNLKRAHYCEYGAIEAANKEKMLRAELARHERDGLSYISQMPEELQSELQAINDAAEIDVSTTKQYLETQKGNNSPSTIQTIINALMSLKSGITPFGTSTEVPNTLAPFDKAKYEGIRAYLVCHHCGLLYVSESFVEKLERLEARVGKLRISSGYRCPVYNRAVGGAEKSYHIRGMAADLLVRSKEEQTELKRVAKEIGFTGFGKANAFLHVDEGPSREWDYGGTV